MESTGQTEILADRLNAEPVIFRGSTSTELLAIVTIASIFWLPFSLFIAISLGELTMFLGIATIGIILSVFFGSTLFQSIKRGRPDFYYQHLVIIKLHKLGLRRAQLVLKSCAWTQGRE